jgi:hypothetical protein
VSDSLPTAALLKGLASGRSTSALWEPDQENEPQQLAYQSDVKWLGYGGAAGGGKTDLAIGKLLTRHRKSIVFRREYPQLKDIINRAADIVGDERGLNRNEKVYRFAPDRTLEFGAMQYEDDKRKYRGRPHDGIAFDEVTEFTRSQVQFVTVWNRTTRADQPCQVIFTFNPPDDPEGEWVIDFFAPWLDEEYDGPLGRAEPGETRWAVIVQNKATGEYRDVWVDGPEPVEIDGETFTPESRTFIPARVEDNRYLMGTGYDKVLDALPGELRDMMRHGIMRRNIKDAPLQLIPRGWVRAAQQRWEEFNQRAEAEGKTPVELLGLPLSQTGADISRGGADTTTICNRYGPYFDRIKRHQGVSTDRGGKVAALILDENDGQAPIAVDVIGVGSSVFDHLEDNHPHVIGLNSSVRSGRGNGGTGHQYATDKSGKYRLANKRTEWWWRFMEALDPVNGDDLMLPPDPGVLRQLTAPRYKLVVGGVRLELKADIKARLGISPDDAEAVIYAHASERPLTLPDPIGWQQ